MKWHKRDPVPYVFAGLLLVSVLIGLAVLGVRSCVKDNAFPLRDPILDENGYQGKPVLVNQKDFGALLLKAVDIDFGTGVAYLASAASAESVIGAPEAYDRQPHAKEIYSYWYPNDASCTKLSQHRDLSMPEFLRCAQFTLVFKSDRLRGLYFGTAPFYGESKIWRFFTLKGKPLTECTRDDLISILGDPTEARNSRLVWYYMPQPPKPDNPIQALYVHAVFNRPDDKLSELYISLD